MRARYALRLFFLIGILVGTLNHVCALPLVSHAEATETGEHNGDTLHAASCEALRSTTAPVVRHDIVMGCVARVSPEPFPLVDHPRVVAGRPIVRGSPPLYLRHAALLI